MNCQRQQVRMGRFAITQWALKLVIIALLILYIPYPTTSLLRYRTGRWSRPTVVDRHPDVGYNELATFNDEDLSNGVAKTAKVLLQHLHPRRYIPLHTQEAFEECVHKTNQAKEHCLEKSQAPQTRGCRSSNITKKAVQRTDRRDVDIPIYIKFARFFDLFGIWSDDEESIEIFEEEPAEATGNNTDASSWQSLVSSLEEEIYVCDSDIINDDESKEEFSDESDDGANKDVPANPSTILPRARQCNYSIPHPDDQFDCTPVERYSSDREPRRRNRLRRSEPSPHPAKPRLQTSGGHHHFVQFSGAVHDNQTPQRAHALTNLGIYTNNEEEISKPDADKRSPEFVPMRRPSNPNFIHDLEMSTLGWKKCRRGRPKGREARLKPGRPNYCDYFRDIGSPLPHVCAGNRRSLDLSNDHQGGAVKQDNVGDSESSEPKHPGPDEFQIIAICVAICVVGAMIALPLSLILPAQAKARKEAKMAANLSPAELEQVEVTEPGSGQSSRIHRESTGGGIAASDGAQDNDIENGNSGEGPGVIQDGWTKWILQRGGNGGRLQKQRRFSPTPQTHAPRIPSLTLPKPTFATVRDVNGLPDIESMARDSSARKGTGKGGSKIKWGSTV